MSYGLWLTITVAFYLPNGIHFPHIARSSNSLVIPSNHFSFKPEPRNKIGIFTRRNEISLNEPLFMLFTFHSLHAISIWATHCDAIANFICGFNIFTINVRGFIAISMLRCSLYYFGRREFVRFNWNIVRSTIFALKIPWYSTIAEFANAYIQRDFICLPFTQSKFITEI